MPLSFRQLGNTFIAGPNIGIYPSGNSFAISGSATGTSVGIESISTIGSGTFSIASSVTNKNLVYKSLSGTSGFGIIDNGAATLLFTSSTPSIGTYISGITSAGTGTILLLSSITSDNNLVYKSISGGTGIATVDDGAGTFKFDKIETGTIISGTNASAGVGVFCGTTTINNANDALSFFTLSGGSNVSVTTNDSGEIVIDRGQVVLNTISNQGGGARIFSAITGNSLVQRTIISANTSGFTAALTNNLNVTGATSAITANTLVRITPTNTTADRFYITTTGPILSASTNILSTAATGNMAISATPVTTSRLLIQSGTTAISQITLTPFSAEPTNPSDGSIWYSTSGNTLKFEKDTIATDFIFKDNNTNLTGDTNSILLINTAGTLIQSFVNSFGAFNALSSVTLTEGGISSQIEIYNTQGSIISTAITGSKTILASTNKFNPELIVGKKFRFNAKGNATINSTLESHTLTFRVKLGSTVIALGTIPIDLIWENTYIGYIEIDATFTIRNSGLVISSGKIIFQNSLSGSNSIYGDPYIFGIYSQNATIITTSDQIFDFTIQSNSLSGNEIIINESTLEILN